MSPTKSVLIFGPGKHFGFQLAQRFGSEGFHVVLIARNETRLLELCNTLEQKNVSCSFVLADVCKRGLDKQLIDLATTVPAIETVIFNIKESVAGNGLTLSPDQLSQALATNVTGALAVVQASLPILRPNASIILTGGGYKDTPDPEKLALSISKGALHTLFLALIEPLRERDVRISTVVIDGVVRESGPIVPERVADAFWEASQGETGTVVKVS